MEKKSTAEKTPKELYDIQFIIGKQILTTVEYQCGYEEDGELKSIWIDADELLDCRKMIEDFEETGFTKMKKQFDAAAREKRAIKRRDSAASSSPSTSKSASPPPPLKKRRKSSIHFKVGDIVKYKLNQYLNAIMTVVAVKEKDDDQTVFTVFPNTGKGKKGKLETFLQGELEQFDGVLEEDGTKVRFGDQIYDTSGWTFRCIKPHMISLVTLPNSSPLADVELDNLSEHSEHDPHHPTTKIPSSTVLGSNSNTTSSNASKETELVKANEAPQPPTGDLVASLESNSSSLGAEDLKSNVPLDPAVFDLVKNLTSDQLDMIKNIHNQSQP